MARREGVASQQFAAEEWRCGKQPEWHRDELEEHCLREPGAARTTRGAAWCWGRAINESTRWWSERRKANGVVVCRVQLAQIKNWSSDFDDFTESTICGNECRWGAEMTSMLNDVDINAGRGQLFDDALIITAFRATMLRAGHSTGDAV